MTCERLVDFYSFKWLVSIKRRRIDNTWNLHEAEMSMAIAKAVLVHSHAHCVLSVSAFRLPTWGQGPVNKSRFRASAWRWSPSSFARSPVWSPLFVSSWWVELKTVQAGWLIRSRSLCVATTQSCHQVRPLPRPRHRGSQSGRHSRWPFSLEAVRGVFFLLTGPNLLQPLHDFSWQRSLSKDVRSSFLIFSC